MWNSPLNRRRAHEPEVSGQPWSVVTNPLSAKRVADLLDGQTDVCDNVMFGLTRISAAGGADTIRKIQVAGWNSDDGRAVSDLAVVRISPKSGYETSLKKTCCHFVRLYVLILGWFFFDFPLILRTSGLRDLNSPFA